AQQTIDNMIGRDIAAQEADLRTKKDASDNALGDLVRRGMSLDQAKGTLRTIQNSWAQQQLSLAKGASNVDAINANYDGLISRMQQANDTEAEKYRQAAEGTATKTIQAQILHPVAGSAGGRVYLTPEQATELAGKKTTLESGEASTGKTMQDIQTAKAGEPAKALETEKANKVAALAEGIGAGHDLLKVLPEGDSEIDDPTKGAWDFVKSPELNHKITELTGKLAKGAQASRGKSDKDAELAERDVAGAGSLSARKRLAQGQIDTQVNALIQEMAGMTPAQRAEQIKAFPPAVQEALKGK
ncbi:MAG TPA: hypothetical protein VN639_07860, partial [Azonexus sp.]|nr:hypothetical protein [Azonexus sp.]